VSEPASTWVSAHIFYQDDLDPLLTHVVAPLIDELRAGRLAQESFYLRYWDGGPHLRLRVLPTADAGRSAVERRIADRFGDYLARNPSADRMSSMEYARLARTLAHREGLTSYAEHRYPNNSTVLIPYRPEYHRYGQGQAMRAVERHFAESSRIALRAITMGTSPPRRTTAAVAIVLLTWFTAPVVPTAAAVEPSGSLAEVARLARQMRELAARAGTSSARGMLIDWARSIATLRDALATHLGPLDPTDDVTRVLDSCAHLICNRLGVSMAAEHALRGLAASVLRELALEGT
jgi:hypothetical protein